MSVVLPTEPIPAVQDITAYNMIIMGDPGIGKSSLLASIPDYLLIDPINGMKGLPGLKVSLSSWQDHLDLPEKIAKTGRGAYAGIGLDCLNISYAQCSAYITGILKIRHPAELAHGTGWARVTAEFIKWLQQITILGYHIVATCHTTIMEVRVGSTPYNRWVPAFVGGSPESAYNQALRLFDIKGFMTLEMEAEPSPPERIIRTKEDGVKKQVDARVDTTDLLFSENRVIYFAPSIHWLAGDTSQMLPEKVRLTKNWREDWPLILQAWGQGGGAFGVAEEPIETEGHMTDKTEPQGLKGAA